MLYTMPKSRRLRRKSHLSRRLEQFNMRNQDLYHVQEKITAADVAKVILGSIITIGGFYSLTVILFTIGA